MIKLRPGNHRDSSSNRYSDSETGAPSRGGRGAVSAGGWATITAIGIRQPATPSLAAGGRRAAVYHDGWRGPAATRPRPRPPRMATELAADAG